mgnify:CR=1 FL=1
MLRDIEFFGYNHHRESGREYIRAYFNKPEDELQAPQHKRITVDVSSGSKGKERKTMFKSYAALQAEIDEIRRGVRNIKAQTADLKNLIKEKTIRDARRQAREEALRREEAEDRDVNAMIESAGGAVDLSIENRRKRLEDTTLPDPPAAESACRSCKNCARRRQNR